MLSELRIFDTMNIVLFIIILLLNWSKCNGKIVTGKVKQKNDFSNLINNYLNNSLVV